MPLCLSCPAPNVSHPEFFRAPGAPVQPDQYGGEFAALLAIVRAHNPRVVVEIGSREGGTLCQWIGVSTVECAIAVDLPGASWGTAEEVDYDIWQRWATAHDVDLTVLLGDSHQPEMLEHVTAALGGRGIDFLFIDGDHSAAGARSDFEMYGPLVRPGGIIAFHDVMPDVTDPGIQVWQVWRSVVANSGCRTTTLLSDPAQQTRGIGVVWTAG